MARQPNIVFIFSDQQRWDTVGCYGDAFAKLDLTPNLDRMALESVRFEYAFTCQPVWSRVARMATSRAGVRFGAELVWL